MNEIIKANAPLPASIEDIEKLFEIEDFIKKTVGDDFLSLPTEHTFAGGMYARKCFVPKNTILVSKLHLTEHMTICLQGDVTVYEQDGITKRVVGPFSYITYPGTKRVCFINEDTVWMTVHRTDQTELIETEAEIFACTLDEYKAYLERINQ